jgi:hypothetical protein
MTRAEFLAAALAALEVRPMTTSALLDALDVRPGAERRRAWRDLYALRAAGKLNATASLSRPFREDTHATPQPILTWTRPDVMVVYRSTQQVPEAQEAGRVARRSCAG